MCVEVDGWGYLVDEYPDLKRFLQYETLLECARLVPMFVWHMYQLRSVTELSKRILQYEDMAKDYEVSEGMDNVSLP